MIWWTGNPLTLNHPSLSRTKAEISRFDSEERGQLVKKTKKKVHDAFLNEVKKEGIKSSVVIEKEKNRHWKENPKVPNGNDHWHDRSHVHHSFDTEVNFFYFLSAHTRCDDPMIASGLGVGGKLVMNDMCEGARGMDMRGYCTM